MEYPDIEEVFWPVIDVHGREMFALVMNAGMARQAVEVLGAQAQKHQSSHSLHAVRMLAQAFNQVSSAYAAKEGWTEEQLALCDRDIQLAFKGKIITPGSAILLNS